MYNLLVCAAENYWEESPAGTDLSRFLEYTNDTLKGRFKSLTDEAVKEIKSYPALFAYEEGTDGPAKIGWIKQIERRHGELHIHFEFDNRFEPISSDDLSTAKRALDAAYQFEMTRTHWAIKEVDLLEVLAQRNILKMSTSPRSNPKFSRQTVLYAADILQIMGHAEFDRFVVGLGVEGLDAGRSRGGLRARSVALGEFAVQNMDEQTADGEVLALSIVRHAAILDPDYPVSELHLVDRRSREGFWRGLEKDGFHFQGGDIVPTLTASVTSVASPTTSPPSPTINRYPSPEVVAMVSSKPRVFIVHGRDDAVKNDVARFIEKIGLEAVILHEQPNGGRTIIQKFQEVAAGAVFAIVLMTPDDVGGLSSATLRSRARQNVIFELGFFIGRLGANKVCALVSGDLEKPSDFDAVVYIRYGSHGGWKVDLAKELNLAKVDFDHSKLIS